MKAALLNWAKVCLFLSGAWAIVARAANAQISVGPNIRVSTSNPDRAHYELWADADPTSPARMLACSMLTADATVVYASADAGRTWTQTKLSTDMNWAGDPICKFGQDGTAYYVVLGQRKRAEEILDGAWVYRSADGGRTWSDPTKLPVIDREYIVTDGTSSRYHGRVYINGAGYPLSLTGGRGLSTIDLYTSADGGHTFTGPAQRTAVPPELILGVGNSVVLSEGTVVSLFGVLRTTDNAPRDPPSSATASLKIVTSTDGGASLQSAVTIDDWYLERRRSEGAVIPQLAVDQSESPFKDRLYAVWTDFRTGRLEVRLAYSADKGTTWSSSKVINDDRFATDPVANGPDAITPIVAVNQRGVLGIAWYDRRESPDNLGWYERFTASLDGGETWLPSVRVSDQANTYGGSEMWPTRPYSSGPGGWGVSVDPFFFSGGHTGAMVVDKNDVFHPFWFDNRTGVSQIWTAPVTVAGAAVRNGSADLATLDDLTAKVAFEIISTVYERASNRLTVMAKLKNTSQETVLAPLVVRILQLRSDVGIPSLIVAAKGQSGQGAVLEFSALLHGGMLLPDSTSDPRQLVFRLTDLRPFRQGKDFKFGLIDVDARVLGKSSKGTRETPR
jgi:hypothetical protein